MKIILVGYPGSQSIVSISRYLTKKYLPDFDIHYLNYVGSIEKWSTFVGIYLTNFTDKFIILALDDYLISAPINKEVYEKALKQIKENKDVACVKLCANTWEEHLGYPVTTQYTIWDREFLVELLSKTTSPWHFEITGSEIFRKSGKHSLCGSTAAIEYNTSSCLSFRWIGIDLKGLKEEDIKHLKENNYV